MARNSGRFEPGDRVIIITRTEILRELWGRQGTVLGQSRDCDLPVSDVPRDLVVRIDGETRRLTFYAHEVDLVTALDRLAAEI